MLWAATVLVVYGVSIVLLRASIKPVADLTAAQVRARGRRRLGGREGSPACGAGVAWLPCRMTPTPSHPTAPLHLPTAEAALPHLPPALHHPEAVGVGQRGRSGKLRARVSASGGRRLPVPQPQRHLNPSFPQTHTPCCLAHHHRCTAAG